MYVLLVRIVRILGLALYNQSMEKAMIVHIRSDKEAEIRHTV